MSVGTIDFRLNLLGETDCSQAIFSHEEVERSFTRHTCDFCKKAGQPPFTRFVAEGEQPMPTELLSSMCCFGCLKEALENWRVLLSTFDTTLRLYEPAQSFLETYVSRYGFPISEAQPIK